MENACEVSATDKVIEILAATSDGNMLAPRDLALTELAINQHMSELGKTAFEKLYEDVCVRRAYDKDKVWYRGVENVSRDHEGYIKWRGVTVEHFSFDNGDRAREAAIKLQRTCLNMERFGLPVSWQTYFDWINVMRPMRVLPDGLVPVEGVDEFVGMVGEERPYNEAYVAERRVSAESALLCVARALRKAGASRLSCRLFYERRCDAMLALTVEVAPGASESVHDKLRAQMVHAREREMSSMVLSAVGSEGETPTFGVLVPARALAEEGDGFVRLVRLVSLLEGLADAA